MIHSVANCASVCQTDHMSRIRREYPQQTSGSEDTPSGRDANAGITWVHLWKEKMDHPVDQLRSAQSDRNPTHSLRLWPPSQSGRQKWRRDGWASCDHEENSCFLEGFSIFSGHCACPSDHRDCDCPKHSPTHNCFGITHQMFDIVKGERMTRQRGDFALYRFLK